MHKLPRQLLYSVSRLPIPAKALLYTVLTAFLVSVGAFPVSANTNFPFLDQLDTVSNLTQYVNTLHTAGPNSKVDLSSLVDNNYGSYASGAGIQQPITVYPSGQKNSPGIIYFPSTDGLGDPDGAGKLARGDGNPVGGGANANGITVLKMSYGTGLTGSYEDAILAVRHVIDNASMYGINPRKVTLMGDSDGANLAMRVGASGRSGAASVVALSPQTNMFTAMFKSTGMMQLALSGMKCLGGLSGGSSPLSGLQQILTQFGNTINPGETITQSIYSQSSANENASMIDMPAQMFQNCIQDFLAASPALTANPDTPPTYLAGFDNDPYIDPQQIYGMRDKLQGLGVSTQAMVTPGDPGNGSPVGFNGASSPIAKRIDGMLAGYGSIPVRVTFPTADHGPTRAIFPDYHGKIGGSVKGRLTDGNAPCSPFDPTFMKGVDDIGSKIPITGPIVKGLVTLGEAGGSGNGGYPIGCTSKEYLCNKDNFADKQAWIAKQKADPSFCGNHLGYDSNYVCTEISFVKSGAGTSTAQRYCESGKCPEGYTEQKGAVPAPGPDAANGPNGGPGRTSLCSGSDFPGAPN